MAALSQTSLVGFIVLFTVFMSLCLSSHADIIDDIKQLRPFELKESKKGCPLPLVGESCPEQSPLYHFDCCGDLDSQCCFRLQDWVWILVIVLVLSVVISIFVNLIRCLCCY